MRVYHVLIIVAFLILIALSIFFVLRHKKRDKVIEEFPQLLIALGGKENIREISFKGSRVSVLVENKKDVNKEGIKNEGVETIVISNNKVTMVVGNKNSEVIYNYLNNQLN